MIINIFAPADIGLNEVDDAVSVVTAAAHPEANIIFGVSFDEELADEVRVTIIATGFETLATAAPATAAAPAASAQETKAPAGNAPSFDGVPSTHKPFNTPFAAPQTQAPAASQTETAAPADGDSKRLISDDDINDIDSILSFFKKRG